MTSRSTGNESGKSGIRPGTNIWLVPAVCAAAFLFLAWVCRPVIERGIYSSAVAQCDTIVREWFRAHRTPELDRVVFAYTLLGTPTAMVLYALTGLSFLISRQRWTLVYVWDTVFLGTIALTLSLKHLFARARPEGAEVFLTSHTYSFPSTHAVSAVAAFGIIAYVVGVVSCKEREQRAVVAIVTVLAILAMGTSRLYLGVHYLSDVAAGLLVGFAWLGICLWSLRRFDRGATPVN